MVVIIFFLAHLEFSAKSLNKQKTEKGLFVPMSVNKVKRQHQLIIDENRLNLIYIA